MKLCWGTYQLIISVSDQGQPIMSDSTSVAIVVQRPAPVSISFTYSSGYTFNLLEESGATTFAQVMLDSIPEYLLSHVSYYAQDDIFSVDFQTGAISTQRNFDYEVDERQFSFQVISTFIVTHRIVPINLTASVNVTEEIVDINDNSPYFINFPEGMRKELEVK